MVQKNLAAIDLGTNSCRIMVTDAKGNTLFRDSVNTKLGEGMYEHGRFTEAAVKRGIDCFVRYAEIMKKFEVGNYRAIATASCRMASNGADFVASVKKESGITLDVVSSEEEAVLNLQGAQLNADKNAEYLLVYDLGGGSTEITLARNTNTPEVIYTISIPWGARNATEAFGLSVYDENKTQNLKDEVSKYTSKFLKNSNFLQYKDKCCAIATSSTPLRLFSMLKNTGVYDKFAADGLRAETTEISAVIDKMKNIAVDEMSKSVYIGANRAPIFAAACVIFRTIYEDLQITNLTASLKGAQEAIISKLEQNNG